MGFRFSFAALALIAGLLGCSPAASNDPAPKHALPVLTFVTILPQVDFVRRIGGQRISAECLVGPGQSHHTYEPTPRQMTRLAQAQVYFAIGVPCEHSLLPKVSDVNPGLLIIDTSAGVLFRHGDSCVHSHGSGSSDLNDGHDHDSGKDPHIWLDPRLVKIQARHIRDGLARVDPAGRADYQRNCAEFETQLDQLHAALNARLALFKGEQFVVFHPAYGYFADAYGLKQVTVEEDGKEPTVRHLTQLIDLLKRDRIKTIFVQPQFAAAAAETIASAVQGRTAPLDPMTIDYLSDMRGIGERLAAALEQARQR